MNGSRLRLTMLNGEVVSLRQWKQADSEGGVGDLSWPEALIHLRKSKRQLWPLFAEILHIQFPFYFELCMYDTCFSLFFLISPFLIFPPNPLAVLGTLKCSLFSSMI